jgi:hypothetical protein
VVGGKIMYRRRQGMYHMRQFKKNVKRKYSTFEVNRKNMKKNGQHMLNEK